MISNTLSSIVINAKPEAVYRIIRHSENWPELFEPCLNVETLHRDENEEHIKISALVKGVEQTWESKRHFRPDVYAIDVEAMKTLPLVKCMQTHWLVVPLNQVQSCLVIEHHFELQEDIEGIVDGVSTPAQAMEYMCSAIDTNSNKELENIRQTVEQQPPCSTPLQRKRNLSHSIVCEAPAKFIYELITNPENFPDIYPACIAARSLEKDGNSELLEIEANQNGKDVSWKARRNYYPDILRVDFSLPIPMPLLKSMSGTWRIVPLTENSCVLNAVRQYELADNVSGIREEINTLKEASDFMAAFIDENIASEMLSIRSFASRKQATFLKFSSSSFLPFSPDMVYQAFADAKYWPDILPHCQEVDIIYDDRENQEFIMQIQTPVGTEHFRSIRRCDVDDLSINYFQPRTPEVLNKHSGSWLFRSSPGGTCITSEHTVNIRPDICTEKFGQGDLEHHKQTVKVMIEKNSHGTVKAIGEWLQKNNDKNA